MNHVSEPRRAALALALLAGCSLKQEPARAPPRDAPASAVSLDTGRGPPRDASSDAPLDAPPDAATDAPTDRVERLRAAVWAVPEDRPAERLFGINASHEGQHYLPGDESHLERFLPAIQGLGGVYVGVGADQGYLLAGWARSEAAFFLDYDPYIVDFHRVFGALVLASETPEAFVDRWRREGEEGSVAVLQRAFRGQPGERALVRLYTQNRPRILRRLLALRRGLGVPSYLDDRSQWEHVRALVRERRARPLVADLLAVGALRGLGAAVRSVGLPVRVLYLSNAEEYWPYRANYRANVRALPTDARGVVLRTLSSRVDFGYHPMGLEAFQAALGRPSVSTVYDVVPRRERASRPR